MTRVRATMTISIDGYGAGPDQSRDNPLGIGGEELHGWLVGTRMFKEMNGEPGGETGLDDEMGRRVLDGFGARIMGRNMFGPVRGPWMDDTWKGWWGPNPPYHTPVFVFTHHPRKSIEMEGGTTFHFVTGTPQDVLKRATESAGGLDVQVCGGVSTLRAYLSRGLVDELHLAISPVLLGKGEHLLHGIDLAGNGYRCTEYKSSDKAAHVLMTMNPQ